MSCYEPLKGFAVGFTKDNKPKLKVVPYNVLYLDKHGTPITDPKLPPEKDSITKYYDLPCGHCLGCRQQQSKEWASRLIMEMQYHDSAYFCTFTYDDSHLHTVFYYDDNTGEVDWNPTLNKRDIQLFIKRLRKCYADDKIRYYLAGEYGETTKRPHYHAIIYGLHCDDLIKCGRSETGNTYFTSKTIEKLWSNGFVSIEPANYATCKYTASYVTKKLGIKPNDYYNKLGIIPPFSLSSRKPGIGLQYLLDHENEFFDLEELRIPMVDGSYKVTMPRYFKKKLRDYDEERYEVIARKNEQAALDHKEAILANTDLEWTEYLRICKENHEQKLRQRNKI